MYSTLKNVILKLVPRSVLFRYEYSIRYLYYLFYAGDGYRCNVCQSGLKSFIVLDQSKLLCPRCGSSNRARRLWKIIQDEFLKSSPRILHFSPSRSLYRVLKEQSSDYDSSDLSDDFIAEESYDITMIDADDESYDLVICYHILEHVPDDRKAIEEIWRILEAGGYCLIQTPFKEGGIYEDVSVTEPEDRKIHFGQSDHVRIYSVEGLTSRLEEVGYEINVRQYSESPDNKHGFLEDETVLVCYKSK